MDRVVCPECDGEGRDRFRRPCPVCWSKPRQRSTGWIDVDSYTGRQISTVEQSAPTATRLRRVICDCCGGWGAHGGRCPGSKTTGESSRRCTRCEGVGHQFVIVTPAPSDPTDSVQPGEALAIAAAAGRVSVGSGLWARGSFEEVADSLDGLPKRERRLVWGAYVAMVYVPKELDDDTAARLRVAFDKLRAEVRRRVAPERVRVPFELRAWRDDERLQAALLRRVGTGRWANGQAKAARNEAIRVAAGEGASLTRLAREYGIARSTVQRILTP
jgi:hypothetical protein